MIVHNHSYVLWIISMSHKDHFFKVDEGWKLLLCYGEIERKNIQNN
jgi:hypothetical protein